MQSFHNVLPCALDWKLMTCLAEIGQSVKSRGFVKTQLLGILKLLQFWAQGVLTSKKGIGEMKTMEPGYVSRK